MFPNLEEDSTSQKVLDSFKHIRNSFRLSKGNNRIVDQVLEEARSGFEYEEDYNKSIKTKGAFYDHYLELEEMVIIANISLGQYLMILLQRNSNWLYWF